MGMAETVATHKPVGITSPGTAGNEFLLLIVLLARNTGTGTSLHCTFTTTTAPNTCRPSQECKTMVLLASAPPRRHLHPPPGPGKTTSTRYAGPVRPAFDILCLPDVLSGSKSFAEAPRMTHTKNTYSGHSPKPISALMSCPPPMSCCGAPPPP